jgi:hypothetical protein
MSRARTNIFGNHGAFCSLITAQDVGYMMSPAVCEEPVGEKVPYSDLVVISSVAHLLSRISPGYAKRRLVFL